MPELPEVETVRRILSSFFQGVTIVKVHIYRAANIVSGAASFPKQVEGKKILSVSRRGKYLLFNLDDGSVILSHLRMEGKYLEMPPSFPKSPYDILDYELSSGTRLVYQDTRKFGTIAYYPSTDEAFQSSPLASLGPEPFDLSDEEFYSRIHLEKGPIKKVLMDQTILAGIGNIYADESLFASSIHPKTKAYDLDLDAATRLLGNIQRILQEAIQKGGSTIRSYHPQQGVDGKMQNELQVYSKRGQPCPHCGTPLSKIHLEGRGTTFCFRCQKAIHRPFVLGITGPIHAGKSTAAVYFRSQGYHYFDADKAVWELYEDCKVQKEIQKIVGKKTVKKGKIDKTELRHVLSSSPAKRKKVERLLDPLLVERVKDQIASLTEKDKILLDVPRLFSSGLGDCCDATILIESHPEKRNQRLLDEGRDATRLMKLNSSYPLKQVQKQVNFIVDNNGSKEDFYQKLKALSL